MVSPATEDLKDSNDKTRPIRHAERVKQPLQVKSYRWGCDSSVCGDTPITLPLQDSMKHCNLALAKVKQAAKFSPFGIFKKRVGKTLEKRGFIHRVALKHRCYSTRSRPEKGSNGWRFDAKSVFSYAK